MALSFKGRHYQKWVILNCISWYLSYKLSLRDLEEMMTERGVEVDHSTSHRWVLCYSTQLDAEVRKRKRPVGNSWR